MKGSGLEPKATGRPAGSHASEHGHREPSNPDQLDLFACQIDESAGLAEDEEREYQAPRKTQISELAGETWQDAFGDAA